jgi:hypothetical protein
MKHIYSNEPSLYPKYAFKVEAKTRCQSVYIFVEV